MLFGPIAGKILRHGVVGTGARVVAARRPFALAIGDRSHTLVDAVTQHG
jgi:hypothetical protein